MPGSWHDQVGDRVHLLGSTWTITELDTDVLAGPSVVVTLRSEGGLEYSVRVTSHDIDSHASFQEYLSARSQRQRRTRDNAMDFFKRSLDFKSVFQREMMGEFPRVSPPLPEEREVDDNVVLPQHPLDSGTYIVSRSLDDEERGVTQPHVHVVEGETVEELWLEIEYLVGEDQDPVTVVRSSGPEEDLEVICYRRADDRGSVYREGWVGNGVPEELQDNEPPRSGGRMHGRNTGLDFMGADFDW